ncbi:MAG TPA: hypothetical protein VFR58_16860 [Flavisolibacter sp.]|nr:hypothetical protein [Flavisolibacter sp.]
MRKIHALVPAMVLLLLGCQKEYSLEGGQFRNCIDCTYLPLCDSSSFVYVDSSDLVDTLRGVVRIGRDTVIGGRTYSSVSGFAPFQGGLMYNCNNQDYRGMLSLSSIGFNVDSIAQAFIQDLSLPIPPGLIQVPDRITTSFLKAGLPAGATWTDTLYSLDFPPLASVYAGMDYAIVAKGLQRQVFQRNFTNVIQVKARINLASSLGAVQPPDIEANYYFAPGTGLIEVRVSNAGTVERVLKLYEYTL